MMLTTPPCISPFIHDESHEMHDYPAYLLRPQPQQQRIESANMESIHEPHLSISGMIQPSPSCSPIPMTQSLTRPNTPPPFPPTPHDPNMLATILAPASPIFINQEGNSSTAMVTYQDQDQDQDDTHSMKSYASTSEQEPRPALPSANVPPPSTSTSAVNQVNNEDSSDVIQVDDEKCQEEIKEDEVVGEVESTTDSDVTDSNATAVRMQTAWRTLMELPDLNHSARQDIKLLDRVMEQTCATILQQKQSSIINDSDRTQLESQLNKIGQIFCATGIKVVELYWECAKRELERRKLCGETNRTHGGGITSLIRSTSDLLYDEISSDGSDEHVDKKQKSGVTSSIRTASTPISTSTDSATPISTYADDDGNVTDDGSGMTDFSSAPKSRKRKSGSSVVRANTTTKTSKVKTKSSSKNSSTKRRGDSEGFSSSAVLILRRWLSAHLDDPYPDAQTKIRLAEETKLTYEQVQHWFINARMRFWRPMLRSQQALLASGLKLEDIVVTDDGLAAAPHAVGHTKGSGSKSSVSSSSTSSTVGMSAADSASLSDLVSVAACATPSTVAQLGSQASASASSMPDMQNGLSVGIGFSGVELKSGTKVKYTALVPKSGRSYMVLDEEEEKDSFGCKRPSNSTTIGVRTHPSGASHTASSTTSSDDTLNAELIAASTLALHIAANYQTPHSYISSHPLHRIRKFKGGGHSGIKQMKKKLAELKKGI